jgi:hypothetical protein
VGWICCVLAWVLLGGDWAPGLWGCGGDRAGDDPGGDQRRAGTVPTGGVPAGDQVVRFSRSGYAAVVTDVRVLPGQVTTVNGTLRPEFFEMEEYEVTAEVFQEQAAGDPPGAAGFVRSWRRSAPNSSAGSGVSDAADIMTKVTGTTVVEGKFAVIRGLGDRYNLTLLNGAEIPTADPYRRAAQLDMIPAGMIDRMLVSKTFTPDLPGRVRRWGGEHHHPLVPGEVQAERVAGSSTTPSRRATRLPDLPGWGDGLGGVRRWDAGVAGPLLTRDWTDLVAPPRVSRETPEQAVARRAQADRVQGYPQLLFELPVCADHPGAAPAQSGSLSVGDTRRRGVGLRLSRVGDLRPAFTFYDDGYTAKYRNADVDSEPYEYYQRCPLVHRGELVGGGGPGL